MEKAPISIKVTLPYRLDPEKIVGLRDAQMGRAASEVVRSIPSDDWFGKVTLSNTLMELADKESGTSTRREKLIKFIEALNAEWELARGKRS
ncbi:MAG: hypothetical protein KGH65_00130 [Candidatus Micrarchaeota archaeon]|nr:hypothetical protein [Candidatus Micrarchaeota archaeon]